MVAHTHSLRPLVADGGHAWRINPRGQHLVFARRRQELEWEPGDYLSPAQPVDLDDDRAFYWNNPDRRFRVRLCSRAEIQLLKAKLGGDRAEKLVRGEAWFTASHRLGLEAIYRRYFHGPASDGEPDEKEARAKFTELVKGDASYRRVRAFFDADQEAP